MAVIVYDKKPQNKISQTKLKYFNQFRSIRTKALRWLQITIDTGKNLRVETKIKERYQKLLGLIKIDVLNIEQQHHS